MKGIKYSSKEKLKALQMWQSGEDILRVAKRFKCTERSLWRWKSIFDGTIESLENKSSRPHTPHPNSHTEKEREDIAKMFEENPNMGYAELYGELRVRHAYGRHFMSMYNFIRKNCLRPVQNFEKYIPQKYETPEMLGIKWQMDVKYVPTICFVGTAKKRFEATGERLYQYTMIDEATRERFIYGYQENSSHNTKDFIKRAVVYFGYAPHIIQTDNGLEFRNPIHAKPDTPHAAIDTMKQLGITHHLIRPYTPRHNGKVERSHRTDQEKFYNYSKFESIADLNTQMADWLIRSNSIPSSALRNRYGKRVWQSPLQKRAEFLEILAEHGGTVKIIDHNTEKERSVKIRFLKNSTRDKAA